MTSSGFTALDWTILVVYLAGTTLLGVWLGRGQKHARDYFVANGSIPWWAVLFSIVATETSALTFISIPGLAYLGDFTFLQIAAGYLLGRIVIAYTLLPRYFEGQLVTAYALLEQRFGLATRRFASVTFMITRAFGDSVRLFATAIPVALILSGVLPPEWTAPAAILVLGACTVLYTYHGGMRAVVWTDVLQTFVYLGGGIAALVLIGRGLEGGWANILEIAGPSGKLRIFDLTLGFDRPHTLVAGLLGGGFLAMASHGADQIIVQRLLAAGSLKDARLALIGSGVVVIAQFALFLLIGVGLWAYYGNATFASPDQIFPSFIVDGMPAGMTGVVIAAILAAAMSTMSGSLNALAAATLHDLYIPIFGAPDDAKGLKLSRRFTFVWALVLIGGALLYRQQGTPVVIIALSIASFTYGGLLGGFFLALFWPRARQVDAILGMTVGILVMVGVVRFSGVAWPWFVLIGTSVTLVTGILSSLSHPEPPDAAT